MIDINSKELKIIDKYLIEKINNISNNEERSEIKKTINEINLKLNTKYYNGSNKKNSTFIGSFSRGTNIISNKNTSDIDVYYKLPWDKYLEICNYKNNVQSNLLYEMRNIIKERYPLTEIKQDNQVIVVNFESKRYKIEIVPVFFDEKSNKYTTISSYDGGSFNFDVGQIEDYKNIKLFNDEKKRIFIRLSKLIRILNNNLKIHCKGIIIDTLVLKYLNNNFLIGNNLLFEHLTNLCEYISNFNLYGTQVFLRDITFDELFEDFEYIASEFEKYKSIFGYINYSILNRTFEDTLYKLNVLFKFDLKYKDSITVGLKNESIFKKLDLDFNEYCFKYNHFLRIDDFSIINKSTGLLESKFRNIFELLHTDSCYEGGTSDYIYGYILINKLIFKDSDLIINLSKQSYNNIEYYYRVKNSTNDKNHLRGDIRKIDAKIKGIREHLLFEGFHNIEIIRINKTNKEIQYFSKGIFIVDI